MKKREISILELKLDKVRLGLRMLKKKGIYQI
jgi:hypothetical protein